MKKTQLMVFIFKLKELEVRLIVKRLTQKLNQVVYYKVTQAMISHQHSMKMDLR